MPDFSLSPVPLPSAGSAAARRDAGARSDGEFAAALDEATEVEATPVARPRADKLAPEPSESVEKVETSDDLGSGAADLAAATPAPAIAPLVSPPPVPVLDTPVPQADAPQDSAPAPGVTGVPVPAPGDATPPEAAAPDDRTDKTAKAPGAAPAAQANGGLTTDPAERASAGRPGEVPAQPSIAARAEADDAGQAALVAQAELAARGRTETAGIARASALQTASIAAALPVVPPVVDGPDVSEGPVIGTDAATAEEASSTPAPAPAQASSLEAPRTRDVIDRANVGRTGEPGRSSAADPGTDAGTGDDGTGQPSAPAAASAARPGPAPVPVPQTAQGLVTPADTAATSTSALASAQAATLEARTADAAQSLSLSTTSRASVETTAQIAAQIVRKLEGRSTRFEMALTPEGLGQVDVSLDIDSDGQLVARLAFDNPLAATELRGRVDELRRQLQEAGFSVADDALSFSQRDPSAGQGSAFDRRPDPRNARAFGTASRLSVEADLAAAPARWMSLTLTPDRVDMKV